MEFSDGFSCFCVFGSIWDSNIPKNSHHEHRRHTHVFNIKPRVVEIVDVWLMGRLVSFRVYFKSNESSIRSFWLVLFVPHMNRYTRRRQLVTMATTTSIQSFVHLGGMCATDFNVSPCRRCSLTSYHRHHHNHRQRQPVHLILL